MEMPIPDDWNGTDLCRYAICWPDSSKWRAILSGLVESPNQGRFWDFSTGNFLQLRSDFRPAYNYNFDLEEVIMSCSDLTVLADAIRSLAGGGGTSSSCGCGNATITIVSGGEVYPGSEPFDPPVDPEGSTPPDGFADMASYLAYKCRVATAIVNGIIQTLNSLSIFTIAQIALGGAAVGAVIAAGLILPVSFFVIILSLIAALGVFTGVLADLADDMETNKAEIICNLYTSGSGQEAMDLYSTFIDAALVRIALSNFLAGIVRQIAIYLLSTDTVNTLFKLYVDFAYPFADCSGCTSPCDAFNIIDFGVGETNAGLPAGELVAGTMDQASSGFTLESEPGSVAFVGGEYVWFSVPDVETCYNLSITVSGWTEGAGGVDAQLSGICGGGTTNINVTTQAELNTALADICIGPCGTVVIRGGSASEFTAVVDVVSYTC